MLRKKEIEYILKDSETAQRAWDVFIDPANRKTGIRQFRVILAM
jgi:hypothetical protein